MTHEEVRFRNFLRHSASVSHAVLRSKVLTLQEKGLYSIICSYGWSGAAFPGQKRLAEENGVSERTIRRIIKRLVELRLITVEDRRKQNKTNVYYIEFPDDQVMRLLFPDGYEDQPPDTGVLRGGDHRTPVSSAHRTPVSDKDLSVEESTVNEEDDSLPPLEFETSEQDEERSNQIHQIKTHFSKRAPKSGFSPKEDKAITDLLDAGIPVETILNGIDLAFERFKPQYSRDRIKSFIYCLDTIYELHEKKEEPRGGGNAPRQVRSGRNQKADPGYQVGRGYYDDFPGIFAN